MKDSRNHGNIVLDYVPGCISNDLQQMARKIYVYTLVY